MTSKTILNETKIEKGNDKKAARNPINQADVQLAKHADAIPEGEAWLYELKYDGYRIMAFVEDNSARLMTRDGNDYTDRFQYIASYLIDWAAGRAMILDGEMVVANSEGKTDFQALQNYMKDPKGEDLTYIIFDILALDGADLRGNRLIQRKETLEGLLRDAPDILHYSQHIRGDGEECFLAACEADLEGIIGKKADSVYSGTRNGDWIELKCERVNPIETEGSAKEAGGSVMEAGGGAKKAESSAIEEEDNSIVEGIKMTSPARVMFEDLEITKADIVRYYERVSGRMLPYVSHRILSIVRCPKGISEPCFSSKHPEPNGKGIVTMPVSNNNGEMEDYFYIENASGLAFEAEMGTLEFHIWGSRANVLEKPDMMVFDLEPDGGMDLETLRRGVKDIRSLLNELSLKAYLKTSGGKGYHVVVPFKPAVSWDAFTDFAKRVAEVMEQMWPDRYTSNAGRAKRKDKIFIDWIRNGRGAASIAPYSIRARKGAGVSMPIAWDELDTVAPDGVTMTEALLRIGGSDPWKDYFQNSQVLK